MCYGYGPGGYGPGGYGPGGYGPGGYGPGGYGPGGYGGYGPGPGGYGYGTPGAYGYGTPGEALLEEVVVTAKRIVDSDYTLPPVIVTGSRDIPLPMWDNGALGTPPPGWSGEPQGGGSGTPPLPPCTKFETSRSGNIHIQQGVEPSTADLVKLSNALTELSQAAANFTPGDWKAFADITGSGMSATQAQVAGQMSLLVMNTEVVGAAAGNVAEFLYTDVYTMPFAEGAVKLAEEGNAGLGAVLQAAHVGNTAHNIMENLHSSVGNFEIRFTGTHGFELFLTNPNTPASVEPC